MRRQEISFVNTVCCMLVMWIHIASAVVAGAQRDSLLYAGAFFPWRASAFVVQGFLFLSALKIFSKKQEHFRYGAFLWGRVKKIGLPYLAAVVVSYAGLILLGYYRFDALFLLKSFFLGNMVAPFYFITILFQFYLLMPLWRRMVEKVDFWLAAVLAALLMRLFQGGLPQMLALLLPGTEFPYNDRIFSSYLLYWVVGCYAGKDYDSFSEMARKNRKIIFAGFGLFLLADGLLAYAGTRGLFWAAFLEDLHTLYVFFAILAVFRLGQVLAGRFFAVPLLRGVDRLSFYIYLYHAIALYFIQDRLILPLGVGLALGLLLRLAFCWGGALLAAAVWTEREKRREVRHADFNDRRL